MINARSESIAEKPSFRNAFKKRRCLIPLPMDSMNGMVKRVVSSPCSLHSTDHKPLAFAGLWETWNKKDDRGTIYKSCTIITTQASESIRDIHHRMPVILNPPAYESWLDPGNQNVVELGKMLKNEIVTELGELSCIEAS